MNISTVQLFYFFLFTDKYCLTHFALLVITTFICIFNRNNTLIWINFDIIGIYNEIHWR